MVNKININFKIFIGISIAVFSVIFAFIIALNTEITAYASSIVEVVSIKGNVISSVNGTVAELASIDCLATDIYAKNIRATFLVDANYYFIEYFVDGKIGNPQKIEATPTNGLVIFDANETGRYEVTCYAYSDALGTEEIGKASISFKNDGIEPKKNSDVTTSMEGWYRTGEIFNAKVDWSMYTDDRSGLYGIYYYFSYPDGTESNVVSVNLKTASKEIIQIKRATKLKIVVYDKVGNVFTEVYFFNNFDDACPPIPSYIISPTIENGNYAKSYEITVNFNDDNGNSGLSPNQSYMITESYLGTNGEILFRDITKAFEAQPPIPEKIVLDKAMDYKIVLYAKDNAGNVSEKAIIQIPNSAFDVTVPDFEKNITREIDLSNPNGICTLGINASDRNESGINRIYIENKDIFFVKNAISTSNKYTATFDCFDFENSLVIVLMDNAGNETSTTLPFPYFADTEINALAKKASILLKKIEKNDYTTSMLDKIEEAEAQANLLLDLSGAKKSDIINALQSLCKMFEENISFKYTIQSAPQYVSTNLIIDTKENNLSGYKKGTQIEVILSTKEGDGKDYVALSGFKKGFTDFFSIGLSVDGKALQTAIGGEIKLGINKPIQYYDRAIALFDVSTGEKINTEIKNNRIYFKTNKNSDYALVVEGGKVPTLGATSESEKTISVFGNIIKLSTFLYIVCGTGGVVILAIVGLIMFKKIRG